MHDIAGCFDAGGVQVDLNDGKQKITPFPSSTTSDYWLISSNTAMKKCKNTLWASSFPHQLGGSGASTTTVVDLDFIGKHLNKAAPQQFQRMSCPFTILRGVKICGRDAGAEVARGGGRGGGEE